MNLKLWTLIYIFLINNRDKALSFLDELYQLNWISALSAINYISQS